MRFGGVVLSSEQITYNKGRCVEKLVVRNRGDRPIQVGSHYHFFEVNRYLEFERERSFGCHLNIPSTTAIRFEPGDEREVEVTPYSGRSRVLGFAGLVMGYAPTDKSTESEQLRRRAMLRLHNRGFMSRVSACYKSDSKEK